MLAAIAKLRATLAAIFLTAPKPDLDVNDDFEDPPDPEVGDGVPMPRLGKMSIDEKGILHGDGVLQVPSVRHSRQLANKGRPVIVCWHWTATTHNTAKGMAKRIQKPIPKGEKGGSVHFWIEGDGTIIQSVPCTRSAWHAGGKTSARFDHVIEDDPHGWGPSKDGRISINPISIGIELVNVGEVRQQPDGRWMGWPFNKDGKKGPIVKASEVESAPDDHGRMRHYQRFTEAQVSSSERLLAALVAEYDITPEGAAWDHASVDPSRKSDAGPLWSGHELPTILARVYGG